MIAPVVLRGSRHNVRLEFSWQGDRYHHQLVAGDRVVAKSVEGTSEDDWPASPPIQQLSLEQIQDEPCVLGVGAAGRGHWSISVRVIECAATATFEFDLACRSKETPGSLASTYDRCDRSVVIEASNGTASTQHSNGNIELHPATTSSQVTHQWKYTLTVTP